MTIAALVLAEEAAKKKIKNATPLVPHPRPVPRASSLATPTAPTSVRQGAAARYKRSCPPSGQ